MITQPPGEFETHAGNVAQPIGKIHPQPWMTAPETATVLAALAAGDSEVRFIGGCVRDAVLKRPVRDIDLALALPPELVTGLLQQAGIRVIPTGIDHGTVTAVVGANLFEITTLRVDVESYGRRARVAFTDDWVADAARRDFTFNALSCNLDGDVYDYFDGLGDLAHGRVRFVGDPSARIGEDVLRLLRFFRFYAWYGRPPADMDALTACRAWAEKVQTLSGERVRVEIFRTLMAADPADAFELMQAWAVLPHVLPEADGIARLRTLTWLDTRAVRLDSVAPDPIRRLAALISGDGAAAHRIAQRLRLSVRQEDRLVTMLARPWPISPDETPLQRARALHRLGAEAVRDLALLAWADEMVAADLRPHGRNERWAALLQEIDAWRPIAFPLGGRDAIALGLPPGPHMGALLRQVETWWEEDGFRADHAACLQRLRGLIADTSR